MGCRKAVKKIFGSIVISLFLFLPVPTWAQPTDPPVPIPFSGIEWLLLAAGSLGVGKLIFGKTKK